ncbi:hypothetical protein BZA77DRAFT_290402 [Pyronema omphalodes]|nr:hypothetical protein BZA77DRAFT_290402 [Pyronema omphalodes]
MWHHDEEWSRVVSSLFSITWRLTSAVISYLATQKISLLNTEINFAFINCIYRVLSLRSCGLTRQSYEVLLLRLSKRKMKTQEHGSKPNSRCKKILPTMGRTRYWKEILLGIIAFGIYSLVLPISIYPVV